MPQGREVERDVRDVARVLLEALRLGERGPLDDEQQRRREGGGEEDREEVEGPRERDGGEAPLLVEAVEAGEEGVYVSSSAVIAGAGAGAGAVAVAAAEKRSLRSRRGRRRRRRRRRRRSEERGGGFVSFCSRCSIVSPPP